MPSGSGIPVVLDPVGAGGPATATIGAYAVTPSFDSVSGLRITDFCRAGDAP